MTSIPPLPKRFKYHVLFSYAEEDKGYVQDVRRALPEGLECFDYQTEPIWGRKLPRELKRRYMYEALFCVVFLSNAYLAKGWTKLELKVVRRAARRKPGYMLPVLLDGEMPREIADIAWLDKTLAPDQLAARIEAKILEPPPKPWWIYVSMEVKVASAAVLLALILFARPIVNHFLPSRTDVAFADANAVAIVARVKNTGPKSSKVVGQRLSFGTLPIKDAELRLDSPAAATIAPGEHDVRLTVTTLEPKCDADGNRPNNDQIEPLLGQQPVELEVAVQESNDAPGHPSKHVVRIPAARLRPFIRKWVPSHVPPC